MNWKACLFLCVLLSANELFSIQEHLGKNQILNSFKEGEWTSCLTKTALSNESEIALLENVLPRATELLLMGQFQEALNDFDFIFNTMVENHYSNNFLLSTALWGKLFCHAYSNLAEEAFFDLYLIRLYFSNECNSHVYLVNSESFNIPILPVANFSNPNERISPDECRNRVWGTANTMRLLAGKIPQPHIATAVIFTIDQLEHIAMECCGRAHWTECLNPITDSWSYLKDCLDKNIAVAPKLAGPK